MPSHAVLTTLADQPGMLFRVTQVLARHDANIEHIDIVQEPRLEAAVYFEFSCKTPIEQIVSEMQDVPGVMRVDVTQSFGKVYGKRVIIMGGGAQVGQVAMGAILEADRHNIRGEHISVDTIPLVGEHDFAAFQGARSVASSTNRAVRRIVWTDGGGHDRPLVMRIEGDGFLRYMVRNIVGTLVEVGTGRWPPSHVERILSSLDRSQAGPTAPAHGLFLVGVDY